MHLVLVTLDRYIAIRHAHQWRDFNQFKWAYINTCVACILAVAVVVIEEFAFEYYGGRYDDTYSS